jgi:hypothetical protein
LGAKFEKRSPSKADSATAMKKDSTSSLVTTITVFERADWRIPAMSTPATAKRPRRRGC